MACPCGSNICPNRNACYFVRRRRWLRKSVRAVVFRWPDRGFWTWCPVVSGTAWDEGMAMGHYDDLETAYADADAWTRGELGISRKEIAA